MGDSTCGESVGQQNAEPTLTSTDVLKSRGALLADSAGKFFGSFGDVTEEQADLIRERCRRRQERAIEALKASERPTHIDS